MVLKTFLTEYSHNGKLYAGADIQAESFEEAEIVAELMGLEVVGEKLAEFDYCEN